MLLGAISVNLLVMATPNVARANEFCQCVKYVQNRIGMHIPIDFAYQANNHLGNLGFTQVDTPDTGVIVVMQPSFSGNSAGHIAFIENYDPFTGKIDTRGTNQDPQWATSQPDENGCSNVSTVGWSKDVRGRGDISFWVRNEAANNPFGNFEPFGSGNNIPDLSGQSSNIQLVNFSGTVMSTNGINLRTDTNLDARGFESVEYQQRLSFDAWAYGETVTDLSLGTPDARWYRLQGTDYWVPSAYVDGNAPGSRPLP